MTRTLLIADDAAVIREMIKSAARKHGWTVVGEAVNGQQAIERYIQLKPDAVTLDLVMPDFDGMHALRGILAADPKAKVLVVSAIEQKHRLENVYAVGASDFVVKPFDRKQLLEALEKLVPSREPAAACT